MLCPECHQPIGEMCFDCGVFFEKQAFVITDFSNFRVKHRRIYKRLDHFKEVLSQFQGKEGKNIPREVVEKVKASLGPKDKNTITPLDVKLSLRKLKLNKYVENIFYLHHVLTGTPLPYIKREIEDKMIRLFKQIERVFVLKDSWGGETSPRVQVARTSFLNYYFVLFKLLDSLQQTDLLPRVPLLKTQIRLKQHDALWRCICEELGWNFRPTKLTKNL